MMLVRLALNLLRRDWRAGEWRLLLLALLLAVGSLSTVGLFADRVRLALQQEATSLIGADLRIVSARQLPPAYRNLAQARGLQTVGSRTFLSMVTQRDQTMLSEIQSVEAGYPLRGGIEIDTVPGVHSQSRHLPLPSVATAARSIPMRGTVWVDGKLLRRMNLHVGDRLGIGRLHFTVAALIVRDVDQAVGFYNIAPRVLMNDADLEATGLLQEGSRIVYRLMFAGEPMQVAALQQELKPLLANGERLEDVRDARPEIRTALERAERFLGLAALTASILAAAAMALAARRFVLRHLDVCAVLRCLGAQQGDVLRLFFYQFLLLGMVAVLAGCALGYATQELLIGFIGSMRDAALPRPSLLPLARSAAGGFVLLFGFTFLPLLQLRRVSPMRVIRRELGAPQPNTLLAYGVALLVLAGLFLWQAGSLQLGLAMLGGLLAGLTVFGLLAWLVLHVLSSVPGASGGKAAWKVQMRHAFKNLARRGRDSALQVVALALGGMALLLLTLVRGDLLQSWQGKLPLDTPNRFIVNIQADQQQPLLDFFVHHSLTPPQLLPMVRGRLVAINSAAVNGDSYADTRTRDLVEREFNLSWAERLPEWNELVSGNWWDSGKQAAGGGKSESALLSVEEGIAKRLNLRLGDELVYDVAGRRFGARISNLRKVQWDSMRVNFFVITTPEVLRDYPASYITSFYLPPDKLPAGDLLVREFPNLLVIDTGAMIEQVRGIMEQISLAVSVIFLFTLASGIAVLYAALLATHDERIKEAAIMRTLGADGSYLRRLHLVEFATLGLLSGMLAAGGALLLGWVLAHFVLEIPYHPSMMIWPVGGLGGVAIVLLAGWLGTRHLAMLPPLAILRD